jgi:hypothetical protein
LFFDCSQKKYIAAKLLGDDPNFIQNPVSVEQINPAISLPYSMMRI